MSSAQVIDGSLKFVRDSKTYINRTPSTGDQNTWTWSCWVKDLVTSVLVKPYLGTYYQMIPLDLWFRV